MNDKSVLKYEQMNINKQMNIKKINKLINK